MLNPYVFESLSLSHFYLLFLIMVLLETVSSVMRSWFVVEIANTPLAGLSEFRIPIEAVYICFSCNVQSCSVTLPGFYSVDNVVLPRRQDGRGA